MPKDETTMPVAQVQTPTEQPQDTPVHTAEYEEVMQRMDNLDKDVKEVAKQFKSIQRSLDAIYEDRDLLTDIIDDLDKVRNLVISFDKNNKSLTQEVVTTVEQKTEQVRAEVHVTSHEMKNTIVQKVVKNISQNFEKDDVKIKKRPFWKRLLFWKRKAIVKKV